MTRRLLLILVSFSLLSGCGFALRGNVTLPAALDRVAIVSSDPDFVEVLEDALKDAGAGVVAVGDSSATVLNFIENNSERLVQTVDANGLATAYRLKYTAEYEVLDSKGEQLVEEDKIIQNRIFQYDPLQELESEEEEEFLKEEMNEEIVLQILRRLSRL